ncbi:MAG: hypothetical protein RIS76_4425 [Verrucomicrobiota bacterium]|jgi:hypothetical protein
MNPIIPAQLDANPLLNRVTELKRSSIQMPSPEKANAAACRNELPRIHHH